MYYFIINPASKSGLSKRIFTNLRQVLDRENTAYKFYYTKGPFHASRLVEEILLFPGQKHIIVIGGDGTLNEAVNGFSSYNDATLSYIPAGSGNDFARSTGIHSLPKNQLGALLKHPKTIIYDQGLCQLAKKNSQTLGEFPTGRKFAISCGIGFDAAICYEALHSPLKKILNKLKLGKLIYIVIALKQICSYELMDAEVLIDDSIRKTFKNIFFIAGMNQPYEGGGFRMTPLADPKDGLLSIAVYYNMSKWKALSILPFILLGLQSHYKGFTTFSCKTIEIRVKKPLAVHTDGEYAGIANHIKMKILPEKIKYLQ